MSWLSNLQAVEVKNLSKAIGTPNRQTVAYPKSSNGTPITLFCLYIWTPRKTAYRSCLPLEPKWLGQVSNTSHTHTHTHTHTDTHTHTLCAGLNCMGLSTLPFAQPQINNISVKPITPHSQMALLLNCTSFSTL